MEAVSYVLSSPAGRYAGRRLIALIGLLLALLWVADLGLLAAKGGAQERRPANTPVRQFTITKIEPDAGKKEVNIFFSQAVPIESLRGNLRLLPLVKIVWPKSAMSPEGRLTLKGRFKYGIGYVVNLPENFTVAGLTYTPTVTSFFMPDRPPSLEYIEQKNAIELDSRELLHVRAENVKSLWLTGIRIPPLLLSFALAVQDNPADWDRLLPELKTAVEQLKSLAKGNKALAPFLLEPFAEKQLFPAPGQKNKALAVSLPLSFRRAKEAGALELIRVSQDGGVAATDPRVFRITDLGLTYKIGGNQLLLWATSLKNAAPLAGVQIVGLTKDNEAFPLGQTDHDGIFIFQSKESDGLNLKTLGKFGPVKRRLEPGELVCLLAGTDKDVSYILLKPGDSLKPEGIWQVRTGEAVRTLKGEVFTERGIYRPGETVHFKGLTREYRDGRIFSPQGEVCTFEITSPKGEKVYSEEGTLSEFGSFAADAATASHWPLGTYTLKMVYGPQTEAKPSPRPKVRPQSEDEDENSAGGNEDASTGNAPKNEASCTFQIQEFKPPRHFVEIDFKRLTRAETGYVNLKKEQEFVKIGLTGAYYAGGPVKHGQVRWKVHKAKTSYQVPGYDNFIFGYSREEPGELIESGQAILDEKGRTELEFPLDRQVLAGESGYLVIASVLDFDGRAASNSKTYQVEPDILVGISSHPELVRPEEEQMVKVAAVTRGGKWIAQGKIHAEVLERSYSYVPKRNEAGDLYWSDQETWRKTYGADLPIENGEAAFKFGFGWYGRYLVAFTYTDSRGRSFASATIYQVESVGGRFESAGKEKAYQILPLSADRPAYEPGQTAKISLRPKKPVSCYLVTLEQNGLLQHRVVKAQKELKDLEIPIQGAYAPNVYVSVLAITPRGEFPVFSGRYDTEAPSFFWGNLNLPVRLEVEQLQVQISPASKELRAEPGAHVTLDFAVRNKKGQGVATEMAVAVVDEGVLALTGFKTPSLNGLTRFDGPLGVFTGDLRAFLLNQTPFYLARNDILTGGGGLNAAMLAKLRKRFEPVAFFNPAVRTGPDGRAQVTFTLPDNMTSYRVYAVAADKGSGFASPERQLVATKDFYLEPGMPSFFNQGDKFKFQVAAFNNTSASGPVKFRAASEGGLALKAEEPSQPLPAKDSMKLEVSGEATQAGPAAARFGAEFQGRADAAEVKLEIKSGHVRDTSVFSGSVSGPAQIKVTLPPYLTGEWAAKVNPGEVQAVLTLSGSPFLRLSDAMRYLLTYPYGCVEQTSSGVLALAALRGVVQDGQVPNLTVAEVDKYLGRGVQRVLGMQTENGGFSYWPGQSEVNGWGSIYAGAALSMAKRWFNRKARWARRWTIFMSRSKTRRPRTRPRPLPPISWP
ncbi:MAG: MG2 domain-containing protein [Deltaproteobacteria bacterium]|nr:MG2 domain-containing protein [Deltaproteobacteria bacterium]